MVSTMMHPVAFAVRGPAISARSHNSELLAGWKENVGNAAKGEMGSRPVETDSVSVTITYFLSGGRIDLDNMAKPILDALEEVVLQNDDLVIDLQCHKRRLASVEAVDDPPVSVLQYLLTRQAFVYVAIDSASGQEVPSW